MCSFTSLSADHSSFLLSPAAPVNMAKSSSSTLNELQEELDNFRRLAAAELRKGEGRNKDLVA